MSGSAAPSLSLVAEQPGSILIVVTHLLGIGHLSRAAAIGRALAQAGHSVTLVSGGRPAALVDTAALDFVQLSPVHCLGTDFRTLLGSDGLPISAEALASRKRDLLATLERSAPDLILTELFPFGRRQLAGEFMALLDAARARRPRPLVLASVRDVLNPPSKPVRADEALAVLGRYYDRVLVHGDPMVTRLWDSWPVGYALADRLVDTGLICDAAPLRRPAPPDEDPLADGRIVVSGGGSAAGLPLYRAAIEAAALLPEATNWLVLVGPGVPEAEFDRLRSAARELTATDARRVAVERARPDFPTLLANAAASVSQAGYNTMVDVTLARVRSVVVPFEEGGEAEQRLRAERLSEVGLVECLPQAELTPARLAEAVGRSLQRPRPDFAGSGRPVFGRPQLDLSGLPTTVSAVADALRRARAREAALARCEAALARMGAAGRFLDVWWRDDDAVALTPALDRLLDLSSSLNVPISLAVVPAKVEQSLADVIAFRPLVSILQHGWAHVNHAPEGQKKIELGAAPVAMTLAEIETGLRRLHKRFPGRFLPVLVPPWNRIDPELIPLLPDIGFSGLSTSKPRAAAEPAPGLVAVNTHCDPIAWRAGGGLREEAEIWADLAAHVEAKLDESIDPREPMGLLTHHLVHDEWTWRFVEDIIGMLAGHPSVRWRTAAAVFKP